MDNHTKKRSAVSFMRRGLGLKGSTQHNGRGVYECYVEDKAVTWGRLKELVIARAKVWKEQGHVVEIKEGHRMVRDQKVETIQVVFNPDTFGPYYTTAYFDQFNYGDMIGQHYAFLC